MHPFWTSCLIGFQNESIRGKVQTLWKGHKILKQSSTLFDIYLVED